MINPIELRKGNYVDGDKGEGKIISLQFTPVLNELAIQTEFGTYRDWLSHFRPIPITEQRLLKLGFTVFNKNKYGLHIQFTKELDGTLKNGVFYVTYFDAERNKDVKITNMKYMHQIQNTYFDLEKKEI